MIRTKFLLFVNVSDSSGVRLTELDLPQVPGCNEIVNIGGNPYRVVERSWALDEEVPRACSNTEPFPVLYAYVKVQKAADFTVNLGDKEY